MNRGTLMPILAATAALALTACGPNAGQAVSVEDYPNRSLEMLVGFGAGGHNDSVARKFAEGLSDELGERVLVVNREGGGGAIASTEGAHAAPNGYEILFAPTGAFTSTMLQQDVAYEIEHFRSIVPLAENTFVVAVPESSPFQTFEDLLDAEGRIIFSAFGEGHPTHVVGEGIGREYDLAAEVVAYPGSPPALQAIVNGDVDFGIQDVTSALPRIESGELRVLAVTTDYVPDALEEMSPGVPSIFDYGLEQYEVSGSQGLVVPKDVPDEIVTLLEDAAEQVVQSEEYVEFIESSGSIIPEVPGKEWFDSYMPGELERYRTLYDELGIPYE